MINGMIVTTEIGAGELAELVKHVQAGNEGLLTQSNKPVARLVSVSEKTFSPGAPLPFRPLKGHRVLTPIISQGELAEEMFDR
jgi:antitoxin (DNA-binding transcriptional repressor) of toxin-antitoxin stability system